MELLQIDSLSNLKNNQGFWDNFVWPLLLVIVVGLSAILKSYFFSKSTDKKIIHQNKFLTEPSNSFSTFIEFCQAILPFLIENNYIFKTFGPNSSAIETESLRTDMNLWEQARIDYIIPNNERILDMIKTNKILIPEIHQELFQRLILHIYAFKKHVENESFDYYKFRFPAEIDKLIKDICFEASLKQRYLQDIIQQINYKLQCINIIQATIFGSILFYSTNRNDIDLVILLGSSEIQDTIESKKQFEKMKSYFLRKFEKNVHLTIFTKNEANQYQEFLDNNQYKITIYG